MRITAQGKIIDASQKVLGSCFISGKSVFTCCHVVTLTELPIHLKVLRPHSFEVPLKTAQIDIFDSIDLVVFTLERAPLPDVSFKPTLVNPNHYRELDIQIYLEKRNWINCSILGFSDNGLTAKMTACPHNVLKGDSGLPVWHNDNVIGILKQRFGDGGSEMTVQPFNEEVIKITDFQSLNYNNFAISKDYLRNEALYFEVMNSINSNEKKPIIIFGLSGTGKTDLIYDIGNSFRKVAHLGNTLHNLEEKKKEILSCELLVVRNYKNQEDIDSLIRLCPSKILVTISNSKELGVFRNKFGEVIQFHMPELSQNQCDYLLAGMDDELMRHRMKSFLKTPFLLRLFRDVFIEYKNLQVEAEFDFEHSEDKLEFNLVERWFEKICDRDSVMQKILALLSMSHYGLDLQSLLSVLNIDRKTGESKLVLLRDRGHLVIDNVSKSDKVVYLHEKIKSALRQMDLQLQDEVVDQYFSFLGDPNSPNTPLITKVDGLVTKMKSMWERLHKATIDGNTFTGQCIEFSQRLEELLPKGVVSERESLWIRDRFGSCVSGYCTEIIPIASIMSQFPSQALFGEMLFEGAFKNIYDHEKSSDSARAHLLYAAVHHWKETTGFQRQSAIEKLEKYFLRELCVLKDPNSIDVEVASIFGGLCFLGGTETAVKLLESDTYCDSYQRSDVGILTLIAALLKDDPLNKTLINSIIRNHSSKISESVAKEDIRKYLMQLGLKPNFVSSSQSCDGLTIGGQKTDASILCRTISLASRNTTLDRYLIKEQKRQSTLLLTGA